MEAEIGVMCFEDEGRGHVAMEAEIGVMCFEDEGRGHKPKNTG